MPGQAGDGMPGSGEAVRGDPTPRAGALARRFLLLVLLASVPAFALLLRAGLARREDALEEAQRALTALARTAADREREILLDARTKLALLARIPEVRDGRYADCGPLLALLLSGDTTLVNLGIAAPDGTVVASAVPAGGPVSVADRGWFRRAVESRAFALGDHQFGRITGKASINGALPEYDGAGALRHVLYAAVDLERLNGIPLDMTLPPRSIFMVLDGSGTVLHREPPMDGIGGKPHPAPAVLAACREEGESLFTERSADGEVRIFAAVPVRAGFGPPGAVLVGAPESEVLGPAERALAADLALLAVAVAAAAAGAVLLGRWLVGRHVEGLAAAARRIAAGDLRARSPSPRGPGEIGFLQDSFDAMAVALERHEKDLSAERAAVERVKESYRRLVDEMPAIFYEEDRGPSGRDVFLSPQGVPVFRMTAEEWRRDPAAWTRVIHPEDRGPAYAAWEAAWESGGPYCMEYRIASADGRERWIRDAGAVVKSARGGTARGYCVDVTEERRLARQVQQSQKMEAVGRLSAGVAHDFNNLLTVITGYSDLLRDRFGEESEDRRHLEEVGRAADRAAVLVRQLLLFSRREEVHLAPLDLNASVRNIEKMLLRLLDPGIRLEDRLDPSVPRVRADSGQIDQVLLNLVVNARDALPRGGRITIRTGSLELDAAYADAHPGARPGLHALLEVEDDGIGMDAETQERIFEPFFTTKAEGKGTGLGLATVYGIVRQCGGIIDLRSAPGRGSAFRVLLPAADGEDGPADSGAARAAPALRGAGRILVVEDENAIRALVSETLRSRGFEVHEAGRGDAALAVAEAAGGPLRAAVIDLGLPGRSGREVARDLRARWPDLPVLFASGSAELVGDDVDLGPGCLHLQKPFTPDRLLSRLAELLG